MRAQVRVYVTTSMQLASETPARWSSAPHSLAPREESVAFAELGLGEAPDAPGVEHAHDLQRPRNSTLATLPHASHPEAVPARR